jgi:hypothetical protein
VCAKANATERVLPVDLRAQHGLFSRWWGRLAVAAAALSARAPYHDLRLRAMAHDFI